MTNIEKALENKLNLYESIDEAVEKIEETIGCYAWRGNHEEFGEDVILVSFPAFSEMSRNEYIHTVENGGTEHIHIVFYVEDGRVVFGLADDIAFLEEVLKEEEEAAKEREIEEKEELERDIAEEEAEQERDIAEEEAAKEREIEEKNREIRKMQKNLENENLLLEHYFEHRNLLENYFSREKGVEEEKEELEKVIENKKIQIEKIKKELNLLEKEMEKL